MEAMKWFKWSAGGVVALGLLLASGTGCSDDEETDSSGGGVTVLTNGETAPDGQTSSAGVTNPVAADDAADVAADDAVDNVADADADAGGDVGPVVPPQLAAPHKVAPANGAVYYTSLRKPYLIVTCQWAPVPGAVDYIFTLNGIDYVEATTSSSSRFGPTASYTWSVRARDAGQREGLSSGKSIFYIRRVEL